MPTVKIPHSLAVWSAALSHAVMIAGAILLYWFGKIDAATLTAVLVAFGGAYSGVAGALIAVKGSQAVTPSTDVTPTSGAPAAPVVAPAGTVKSDL